MSAPTISPLVTRSPIHPKLPAGTQVFSVLRDGSFHGRFYRAGEYLLVSGAPQADEAVVMVPSGVGRPQLGSVDGVRLVGSFGEPCSRSRWAVSGRVAGVGRLAGSSWTVEWFDAPGIIQVAAQAPSPIGQLSLFAA